MANYKFNDNWTSYEIPRWSRTMFEKDLTHDKKLRILELGVYEACTTVWLADTYLDHKDSYIHCVDSFAGPMKPKEKIAEYNISQSKYPHKISLFKCTTDEFFEQHDEVYDVIYIDACHKYRYVLSDGRHAANMLAAGGLLIFDDYDFQEVRNACQVIETEFPFLTVIEPKDDEFTRKRIYTT